MSGPTCEALFWDRVPEAGELIEVDNRKFIMLGPLGLIEVTEDGRIVHYGFTDGAQDHSALHLCNKNVVG